VGSKKRHSEPTGPLLAVTLMNHNKDSIT